MLTTSQIAKTGIVVCLLAVAAGAFGAHGLRAHLDEYSLGIFEIAVRYQMFHGIAILACAWIYREWGSRLSTIAFFLFVFGIAVFSGSLYALSVSGLRWLGAITPIGGTALLAGWVSLFFATTPSSR